MVVTYGPTSQDNQQSIDGSIRNYSLKMLSSFIMVGEQIGIAKFYLKYRSGYPQPSGTMYATIYNDSGSIRSTSEGVAMSTTTDSFAWYEFCFTSRPTISADDYVSFTASYDSAPGTTYGWLDVGRDSTGAGSDVELWLGGSGSPDDILQESSGRQPTLELTTDTCAPVPGAGGTLLPPPVAWVNV